MLLGSSRHQFLHVGVSAGGMVSSLAGSPTTREILEARRIILQDILAGSVPVTSKP